LFQEVIYLVAATGGFTRSHLDSDIGGLTVCSSGQEISERNRLGDLEVSIAIAIVGCHAV
jgi:hypothetical protein